MIISSNNYELLIYHITNSNNHSILEQLPNVNIITNSQHSRKHGVLNGIPPRPEGQLCLGSVEHLAHCCAIFLWATNCGEPAAAAQSSSSWPSS